MKTVLNLFVGIVTQPSILVALIAMLGLLLQKKKSTEVVQGTIKTFAGFLVLTGGAGILQNALSPLCKELFLVMKQLLQLPWLNTAQQQH